jgi:hypothetical protein
MEAVAEMAQRSADRVVEYVVSAERMEGRGMGKLALMVAGHEKAKEMRTVMMERLIKMRWVASLTISMVY